MTYQRITRTNSAGCSMVGPRVDVRKAHEDERQSVCRLSGPCDLRGPYLTSAWGAACLPH